MAIIVCKSEGLFVHDAIQHKLDDKNDIFYNPYSAEKGTQRLFKVKEESKVLSYYIAFFNEMYKSSEFFKNMVDAEYGCYKDNIDIYLTYNNNKPIQADFLKEYFESRLTKEKIKDILERRGISYET